MAHRPVTVRSSPTVTSSVATRSAAVKVPEPVRLARLSRLISAGVSENVTSAEKTTGLRNVAMGDSCDR